MATATYAADSALTITLTSVSAGGYRSSANFDNSTNGYIDVLVGGVVSCAGTSWAAGETINIYLMANYSDTTTDIGGARDAAYAQGDGAQVDQTDFIADNLHHLAWVISLHDTATTNMDYHWGPVSVSSIFGSVPKDWHVLVHNGSAAGSIDGGDINTIGITYG